MLSLNSFCYDAKKNENKILDLWKFLVLEQIKSNWKIPEEILYKIKILLEKKKRYFSLDAGYC